MIAFHQVKNSPLIIGIVNRIKINSEQLLSFSESELSTILFANCTHNLRLFRLIRGDSSGMDKSSSATWNVFYTVMVWNGSQVPRDEKSNKGVGDFRFINILQLFLFISFFQLFSLYHFFLYFFNPRHLRIPTPTAHDLYPLPTTHDI